MTNFDEFKKRYKERLEQELKNKQVKIDIPRSKNYNDFRNENYPTSLNRFENTCNWAEKILNIEPDDKIAEQIKKSFYTAHLNATPKGLFSLAILVPIVIFLIGLMINTSLPLLFGVGAGSFGIIITLGLAISGYFVVMKMPSFIEQDWRMKSSSEMVLSVFYIVTYMRHTSNLENGIGFAAEHLSGPLAIDLKKVLWDMETQKYDSIKESLDNYLEFWKDTNMEFVESMHLIESSLYEGNESRRLDMLDKSLDVILDETYEKMLHYSQNLKAPITTLHMMGVILPILGMVMLPLIGGFMTSDTNPMKIVYIVSAIYNLIIPISVYYFSKSILSTRPGGYKSTDISKLKKYKKYQGIIIKLGKIEFTIPPLIFSILIAVLLIFAGLFPLMMKSTSDKDLVYGPYLRGGRDTYAVKSYSSVDYMDAKYQFLGYKEAQLDSIKGKLIGPYGIGASLLSLLIPLGLGLSLGFYFKNKTKNLMKIRENSMKLEQEFSSSLFQLGNRLGDGLPAEIAFQKVSETVQGSTTGKFFSIVSNNIQRLGLSVKDALFDPQVGAVNKFPSNLIESSMKVLIQASQKGPLIAAQALMNISRYVKEIHRVNERLKDLMADIISSMKSQINFLSPVIAGVVMGITSMVTLILSKLRTNLDKVMGNNSNLGGMGGMSGMLNMFGDGVPTYYLQITIGIYIVQLIFLLSTTAHRIENGDDPIGEKYNLGKSLIKSTITYVIISAILMLLFNMMAIKFLPKT